MKESKYTNYMPEMLEMRENGKTNVEIAGFLNEKEEKLNATESAVSGAIKRYNDKKDEKPQTDTTKTVPENQEGVQKKEEPPKEKSKKDLPKESKAPVLDTTPLKDVHKNFVNTLQEYREDREVFSIMTDEFYRKIENSQDVSKSKPNLFVFTGIWLLTIVLSGFGGFYLGRTFPRTAILYVMNMIGIPGGVFIGLAISIAILYKTKIGEQVNKAIVAGISIIFSSALAVLLTVYIPGRTGAYIGSALIGLTFLCLLFPKKKDK